MAKLYDRKPISEPVTPHEPKPETISKILGFSKALSITRYRNMIFETLNN
jgi:hypothetical protein